MQKKEGGMGKKVGAKTGKEKKDGNGYGRRWKGGTYDDVDDVSCRPVVWYEREFRLYLDEMK